MAYSTLFDPYLNSFPINYEQELEENINGFIVLGLTKTDTGFAIGSHFYDKDENESTRYRFTVVYSHFASPESKAYDYFAIAIGSRWIPFDVFPIRIELSLYGVLFSNDDRASSRDLMFKPFKYIFKQFHFDFGIRYRFYKCFFFIIETYSYTKFIISSCSSYSMFIGICI